MGDGSTNVMLSKNLDTLYSAGVLGGLSDAQLLDRFLDGSEGAAEAAFMALVERHGPMVLRIGRQWLGDPHEAEDAFQATFLVLVSKARSVRRRDSVASWLHGVARRVAHRAKLQRARRRAHEQRSGTMRAESSPDEPPDGADSWPELHEAIDRLPQRYREPVVLCYLEGLTTEAASLRLGCPQGTVLSRLSRARQRLRRYLTGRGLAVPAGLLTAGLVPEGAAAMSLSWPPALVARTVRAVFESTARPATAAVAASTSKEAATLAQGVLHAMTMSQLKIFGAALLAGIVALGSVPTVARQLGGAVSRARNDQIDSGPPAAERPSPSSTPAKIQELTRQNAELQRELREIRTELNALRAGMPRGAGVGAVEKPDQAKAALGGPRAGGYRDPNDPLAWMSDSLNFGGENDEPRYAKSGSLVFVTSPVGDQLTIYNSKTNRAKTLQLPGTRQAPLAILPILGPRGLVTLHLEGPKITHLYVFSVSDWAWYPMALKEPVAGHVTPTVGLRVVACRQGRTVYAFSGVTRSWDTLELPEDVPSRLGPTVSSDGASIEYDGKLDRFGAETGQWTHTDIRALVDAAVKKEQEAEAEK